MTTEMINVYESIIAKTAQMKKLDAELKELKEQVLKYHNGQKIICENGFESVIKHTVRNTPQINAIAIKFGIKDLDYEHHAECFKHAEYDSISVKKLICE